MVAQRAGGSTSEGEIGQVAGPTVKPSACGIGSGRLDRMHRLGLKGRFDGGWGRQKMSKQL